MTTSRRASGPSCVVGTVGLMPLPLRTQRTPQPLRVESNCQNPNRVAKVNAFAWPAKQRPLTNRLSQRRRCARGLSPPTATPTKPRPSCASSSPSFKSTAAANPAYVQAQRANGLRAAKFSGPCQAAFQPGRAAKGRVGVAVGCGGSQATPASASATRHRRTAPSHRKDCPSDCPSLGRSGRADASQGDPCSGRSPARGARLLEHRQERAGSRCHGSIATLRASGERALWAGELSLLGALGRLRGHRDTHAFISGVVEGAVENLRFVQEGVEHHNERVGLCFGGAHCLDEITSVMLA
jgi:hypothetical protein